MTDEQAGESSRRRPWWSAEVNSRPLPSRQAARPGPVGDGDDERLARLRRRVVEPVVRSTMTTGEVEGLSVRWGADGRPGDVWVVVDAPGGRYEDWLPSLWWAPDPLQVPVPASEVEIAEHLADRLQDWLAESSFAWGQPRRAAFQLPRD